MDAMMTAEQQSVYSRKLTCVIVTLHSICVQVKVRSAGCVHIRNVEMCVSMQLALHCTSRPPGSDRLGTAESCTGCLTGVSPDS